MFSVEKVKHGKWIQNPYAKWCSICGRYYWRRDGEFWNYCPNCGSKMDKDLLERDHYDCTGCGFASTCTDEEQQQCLSRAARQFS